MRLLIHFIFLISFISLSQTTFAAAADNYDKWASEKICGPSYETCMNNADISFKYSTNQAKYDSDKLSCEAGYKRCANDNGVIEQKDGGFAQMYHPNNPRFIECKKTIDNISTKEFAECMNGKSSAEPKKDTKSKTEDVACPAGTTVDKEDPSACMCSGAAIFIERGSNQVCPNACNANENKEWVPVDKMCRCVMGFDEKNGQCVKAGAQTDESEEVVTLDSCLQDLKEKIESCDSSASEAVDRCDPERPDDDKLNLVLNIVRGAAEAMKKFGSAEACGANALASTTGYHALSSFKDTCSDKISACKSACNDSVSYIDESKEALYTQCRKKMYDDLICKIPPPGQQHPTEAAFNAEYDRVNKAAFEEKISSISNSVNSDLEKCESQDGDAVTKRERVNNYMNDLNSSYKSASTCECQLATSSGDCSNIPGPADCALNPSLAGCARAKTNCFDPAETNPLCKCIKAPGSAECLQVPKNNSNNLNSSGFAGFDGSVNSSNGEGVNSSGKAAVDLAMDNLLNSSSGNKVTSGSTSAENSASPFGLAAGGGGGTAGISGGSSSGGASEDGDQSSLDEDEKGIGSKIKGLFKVAKGSLASIFGSNNNLKKGSSESSKYSSGIGGKESGGNVVDPTKWRPKKLKRGLAGGDDYGDDEFGNKFDDIWKVMNKRYKAQDQKETFLLGEIK